MKFDKQDKVVKAPDALGNPLYQLMRKAAKMNAKNRHFIMPTDNKAHYTDHLIQGWYHCVEINNDTAKKSHTFDLQILQ